MTRYNLSEIMTAAHDRRRRYNSSMSQALRDAWAQAKLANRVDQKTAFKAAFMAKNPTGSIEIHQFWMGATVQFKAGGKTYTYMGHGWQERLGINVA